MKEIKQSIKRIYSRFVVLTAVVVFGAIAIAQAQKDPSDQSAEAPPRLLAGTMNAAPIPVRADAGQEANLVEPARQNAQPHAAVVPASADAEFTEGADPVPSLPGDWSTPSAEHTEHAETGFENTYPEDGSAADTSAFDTAYDIPPYDTADPAAARQEMAGYDEHGADASFAAAADDSVDASPAYDRYDSAHSAPPLLPDDLADAPSAHADDAGLRRNPYRGSAGPVPASDPDTLPPAHADAPMQLPSSSSPSMAAAPSLPADDSDELMDQDESPAAARYASDTLPPTGSYDQSPAAYDDVQAYDAAPRGATAPPAMGNAAFDRTSPQDARRSPRSAAAAEVARRSDFEAKGRPGPQTMEGPQTPTLTLQKIAPQELQVGRAATFQIKVRNIGRVTAENVVIRDEVPAGTDFIDASPKATPDASGAVLWEAGSLAPGQELTVAMQLMPTTEGQVGSVATVSFAASASARTRATKPELVLEHTGPVKVLLGEQVRFAIKLSNPGTGAATKVVLQEDVPSGLSHPSGSKLEYEVGTIEPGQTRHLELTLRAAQAGPVLNKLVATAEAGLVSEDEVELEVIAPQLQVAVEGPKRRYLERQATFTVAVANPGTAPARNVELVAQLPPGLQFVSTNNSGYYDQSRHAVVWSLEQLPAGEMGRAQFTAMPMEIGSYQIRAQGRADSDLKAEQEHPISIEGIAALLYVLADKVDPLEVNGQTTYEIKVTNQGSKDATNVRFAALVPDGMRAVSAKGPTAERIQGQQVEFAPLERLAPKEEAIFQVTAEGVSPGDHRFRVQMISDEISTPVVKEESTRVYAD